MELWNIVDKDGYSFCDYADDGSIFYGYNTKAEAQLQLDCMREIDEMYEAENEWHIVKVEI